MLRKEETICAPATPPGGAIAVIRLSGAQSFGICEKIFFPVDKRIKLADQKGYSIFFGEIRTGEEVIDEVLVSLFRSPNSYTGDDSVEISCHGSSYIQRRILELLILNGAVTAMPGEFTQRAFLNGKLDLMQAEAVADVVASSSKASHRIAMSQMRGSLSGEVKILRDELLHFASLIELELDFGEEDVEFADRGKLKTITEKIISLAESLASSFRLGNAIKKGIPVAIVGKPNSGKSTLLNALLLEEKAIVSEIPGTTRDTIEDTIVIDGIEFRFIDTAGLRETSDVIEQMGIRRTHEKINQAMIVLLVDEVGDDPARIRQRADAVRSLITGTDKRLFVLINKTDRISDAGPLLSDDLIKPDDNERLLYISAKEKTGLDLLKHELKEAVLKEKSGLNDIIITNLRHYEALRNVSESLRRVRSGLEQQIPDDLIAIDIRHAVHYLGTITGEITSDEILANIFRNFCIGK